MIKLILLSSEREKSQSITTVIGTIKENFEIN